jgi:HEAT repeat protein/transcriptional regulator with XRE-family HTH domain
MRKFAQLLTTYVEASGMKQTRIASAANISYNYLQRLLGGDRNPSDQVVYKLSEALHLSREQTGELLAAAGFAPPMDLLQPAPVQEGSHSIPRPMPAESSYATLLAQQLYRLAQDIPEPLQAPFLAEMKHLFGYARYKYILTGGTDLLDLNLKLAQLPAMEKATETDQQDQSSLDVIAQLIAELHNERGNDDAPETDAPPQLPQALEDMLSAVDRLTGSILAGEISVGNYQPQFIVQTLDLLREGAPWEIRRRIAEALPGISQLDAPGAEHLMETLRLDLDDIRGADIRRRVVEALPALFCVSPRSLPTVLRLLRPRSGDDIYVALASIEAYGDIQLKIKQLLENASSSQRSGEQPEGETLPAILQRGYKDIAQAQRHLITHWEGTERECLQFSLALHNLLSAPDTLLISLREGLQSPEKLIQYAAARYLERLLDSRPGETLDLYKLVLENTRKRNVRRTIAKALPVLLQCLKEASLSTRARARAVIGNLATDPDLYIRRAVADHAMQIFYIDREFLLILLRQMQKESDQAIRHRLQPVALRLAQVWLVWYAETAGLVETKHTRHSRNTTVTPFGE